MISRPDRSWSHVLKTALKAVFGRFLRRLRAPKNQIAAGNDSASDDSTSQSERDTQAGRI